MHLLTQSALLQALGWTLINSLWQMGLLWLAYCLLTRVLSSAPAHFRHGLALTLLGFGALGSMITFIAAYFFTDGGWNGVNPGAWGTGNRLVTLILPWCSTFYLLVLGVLLVRYSRQYLYSRRLTRVGLARVPAELRVFVASTSRLMGIRPEVKTWLSTLVDVPLTIGSLKPVILLPAAMITNLSTQQVEAILVHELAHIRRKDYLLNLGITIIGLLFFFNPFSRLLIRQLQKEREHCCDDEVLQFRYDPHAYVSALLSLARQHRPGRLALAATGGGDEQLLLQRARKILQQKITDRKPGARPFILLFLSMAIAGLSLSTHTRQQPMTGQPVTRQQSLTFRQLLARQSVVSRQSLTRRRPLTSPQQATQEPVASQPEEMIFKMIANTNEPATSPGDAHSPKRSEPVRKARAAVHQDGDGDRGDEPEGTSVASSDVQPQMAGVYTQPATLTITARPAAPRDNSLGKRESADDDDNESGDDLPPMDNLVFVPNSSFSFKQVDTFRPEDKLSWIEASTEREIRAQVTRLRSELQAQVTLLHNQEAQARGKASASQLELKKLLNEQIRIQQDYLRKLDQLQQRIKKTAPRRLTTVYI